MNALRPEPQRRGFLRLAASAGGLLLEATLAPWVAAAPGAGSVVPTPHVFTPHLLIRIDAAGQITLLAKNPEMGQGVRTSLPMLIAEELDVGLDQVRIEQAPWDPRLADQGAGGSNSVTSAWEPLRRAGATARWLLVSAAAARWGVPNDDLVTERATVRHPGSGRTAGYGELADAAARLPLPEAAQVKLKERAAFRLIGRGAADVDTPAIVRGEPLFCLDQHWPRQRIAMLEQSPVFGGVVVSANLEAVRRLPGVHAVFVLPPSADVGRRHPAVFGFAGFGGGVAIVADNTWAALRARRALQVRWDGGAWAGESSERHREAAVAALSGPGREVWRDDGDARAALAKAARVVDATYEAPTLAHATMEPMGCLAERLPGGGLRLLSPSQIPESVPAAIERVLGVPSHRVRVELPPRLGGGFGRRTETDFALAAAAIALRVDGPVKLVATREDDMQHDFYRPPAWGRYRAGLDAEGRVIAWHLHTVRHAFRDPVTPRARASLFPARFIEHYRVEASVVDTNLPAGVWRAPGNNTNAFMLECFVDELAHAAGVDPLQFRLRWLGADRELEAPAFSTTRMKRVLSLAAEKAGWGRPLPPGRGLGIAGYASYGGYVAHVVEVAIGADGRPGVPRVTSAVDVGLVVNPRGAEQQVQGAVIDGLASSFGQAITLKDGAVEQSNFDRYPLLRLADAPRRIDVHFVASDQPPSGLGEPPLPPLAPALCNALFAATGTRVRSLPLSRHFPGLA